MVVVEQIAWLDTEWRIATFPLTKISHLALMNRIVASLCVDSWLGKRSANLPALCVDHGPG